MTIATGILFHALGGASLWSVAAGDRNATQFAAMIASLIAVGIFWGQQ